LSITEGAESNCGGRYTVTVGGTVVKICDKKTQLLPYTSQTWIRYGSVKPDIDDISITLILTTW
jgi:hypothetical protein